MSYDTICSYCGQECYTDEMVTPEQCKTCHVDYCLHKNIMREYEGSSVYRARWTEHCIDCGVFREMRFYFPTESKGYQMTLEDWEHDEVNVTCV